MDRSPNPPVELSSTPRLLQDVATRAHRILSAPENPRDAREIQAILHQIARVERLSAPPPASDLQRWLDRVRHLLEERREAVLRCRSRATHAAVL